MKDILQKNNDELKVILKELLTNVKKVLNSERIRLSPTREEYDDMWNKMVDIAFELSNRIKPVHHKYMIKNRECTPDNKEFYNHIHPIEDLLAYMNDPHANDDNKDITLNHTFELKIEDSNAGNNLYSIRRNKDGWHIDSITISGNCDRSGNPYFFNLLKYDK